MSKHKRGASKDRYRRKRRLISLYGGTCFWCGEQIDLTVPKIGRKIPPMTYSTDELVPISRGGKHRLDNQVPAHRKCNNDRGSQVAPPEAIERHHRVLLAANIPSIVLVITASNREA